MLPIVTRTLRKRTFKGKIIQEGFRSSVASTFSRVVLLLPLLLLSLSFAGVNDSQIVLLCSGQIDILEV